MTESTTLLSDAISDPFQIVAETVPAMLWMGDETGKCVYLNRALRAFWGVSLSEVSAFDWGSSLHPDDGPALAEPFSRAMANRATLDVEARYRRADGAWRILHTHAEPRFDREGSFLGMVGVNTDVTETRELERKLRLQALLLECMTEGVSLSDESGSIVYTNSAEDALFGYDAGELIGLHVTAQNAYPLAENETKVAAVIQALKENGKWSGDWRNRRKDGSEFISASTITRVDIDGSPHFLCVQRDVTESRATQEREHLLAAEIDHRAKNVLAVVQSLVRHTPFSDRETFVTTVNGRIDAVARAHTVLSLNAWTGASLRDLINAEFSPFRQLARITIDGPDLILVPQAAQALSLLVHELTTNAVKYGSLSVPDGRLAVTWDMCVDGRALVEWSELGGT